jgi:hypothetical protein
MKKMNRFAVILALLVAISALPIIASAQEVDLGADLVSSYVWRGLDCGDSAAIQPYVEFDAAGFALGAWGSYTLGSDEDGAEADLYIGYGFDFGLYLGVTDYFFPDGEAEYLDYDNHTLELNVGYEVGPVSFTGGLYFDDNSNDDMYVEVAYDMGLASVFLGGGDESYTTDGDFAICNLGVSAEKEIASLPMFGSVILNPDSEQMYIVVGVSF